VGNGMKIKEKIVILTLPRFDQKEYPFLLSLPSLKYFDVRRN
jgi:hypothetical protein